MDPGVQSSRQHVTLADARYRPMTNATRIRLDVAPPTAKTHRARTDSEARPRDCTSGCRWRRLLGQKIKVSCVARMQVVE
jgi:hypothetical protein